MPRWNLTGREVGEELLACPPGTGTCTHHPLAVGKERTQWVLGETGKGSPRFCHDIHSQLQRTGASGFYTCTEQKHCCGLAPSSQAWAKD